MSVPMLPSLKEDSKIAIPKSGEWIADSSATLGGLVDSLKVAANKYSNISSIPDVWARPILVHSILADKEHPQHQQYVDTWRGILAIIALRKMRNFTGIKLEAMEVPETDHLHDTDPEFLKVLARSVPLEYLQKQNDKTIAAKSGVQAKIQLLTFGHDQPLALIWPSTLICPALGLDEDRMSEVPWWKVGGIDDPVNDLSTDEKISFYAWLQHVVDQTKLDNDITELLANFRDDIQKSLGDAFKEITFQGRAGAELGITGACQAIDMPIIGVVDDSFLTKSQVCLAQQRKDKQNLTNLLIVTPDLDKQWNMSASEIIVGGYVNATSCLHKGSGLILNHSQIGDIDLTDFHAEIHMADEFFTDKIAVFYDVNYNAMPNVLGNKVYEYDQTYINLILPVKRRILDYLEPEFIADHTQVEIIGQDIKVILELPVSGISGQTKMVRAEKLYRAARDGKKLDDQRDIIVYDGLPLIQVWPNIKLRKPNAWKTYYTYFDTEGAFGSETDFHAEPVFAEGKAVQVQVMPGTKAEISQGQSFPEAFACERITKSLSGSMSREEIGLLILNRNNVKEVSTNNSTCKIGIDFGTTNTTAYLQIDGDEPRLVHFQNRKFNVIQTGDTQSISGYDKDNVRRNFISEYEQPGPEQSSIKTMFHANPESMSAVPFFSGNIYYLDNAQNVEGDQSVLPNLKNDMKWDQVAGLRYMEGFLTQFSLQCLVEAICTGANTFEWMYSYPKAFSVVQKDSYDMLWKTNIINSLRDSCSLSSSEPQSLSESESVAEYFKEDMQASPASGMICLDIGGGSTDIAVWQGSEDALLNQTSIKFAGRTILNQYLWNRQKNGHNIFAKLKNAHTGFNTLLENLIHETVQKKFDLKLEALLRDYEEEIFKSLPTKRVDPEISLLTRDITFALSGIFFYCGILIGYLRKTGRYNKQKLLPNFYIGGNASKLLNWTAAGTFTRDSRIGNMFKISFIKGILLEEPDEKLKPTFTLNMTDRPKQEVAYGLVMAEVTASADDFDFFAEDDDTLFLAGEKFSVAGEPQANETLTAQEFLQGISIDNEHPIVFEKFVDVFNHFIKKLNFTTINFTDADYIEICTHVNQILSDMKANANGDERNVAIEPIFIIVLKEAYSLLSSRADL